MNTDIFPRVYNRGMNIKQTSLLKIVLLALATFFLYLILDYVWFAVMQSFYLNEIRSITHLTQTGEWDTRIGAAFLVYVFMTLGLGVFVLHHSGSYKEVALYGALFGFVLYGVTNFTNLTILSAWTPRLALVDIFWGTVMNTIVAVAGKRLVKTIDWHISLWCEDDTVH